MPMWSVVWTQNGVSPLMENLLFFHDHVMTIMIMILTVTGVMSVFTVSKKSFSLKWKEVQEMEIFWSLLPMVILIVIAIPSLSLLYLTEEPSQASLSLKVIGNQWYWSYEYSDIEGVCFDSFMTNSNPRNLMTNNHLILPSMVLIKAFVSSNDVIHSWAVSSIGMKVDAIPGRINQLYFNILKPGVLTGQCSEICGMNHSFMPITISSLPVEDFIKSINMVKMQLNLPEEDHKPINNINKWVKLGTTTFYLSLLGITLYNIFMGHASESVDDILPDIRNLFGDNNN